MEMSPGFLIAVPQLEDGFFIRSVVLLIHHDETGAMGLVVNRPLDLELSEVAQQHGIEDSKASGQVFFGGPIEGFRGFVVHCGELCEDDTKIADGVLLTGSVEVLRTLLIDGQTDFRLYLGYAGWGPGQLDQELAAGDWVTGEFQPSYLFDLKADDVWETALADLGIMPHTMMQGSGDIN